MTYEDLAKLREKLLMGDPPYGLNDVEEVWPIGPVIKRKKGTPGIEERRHVSEYDTNAAGIRMALEACFTLTQHLMDGMKKK